MSTNNEDYGLNCESELDDLETTETIIEVEENSETEMESENTDESGEVEDDISELTAEIWGWYV